MSHAKNVTWLPNEMNWTHNSFLSQKNKQPNEPIKMNLANDFSQMNIFN